MNFPLLMAMDELYFKSFRVDDSEAHVGATIISAILRPFTAGELAVIAWMKMQDTMNLVELVYLPDGRDLCVFERLHTVQTLEQAKAEAASFVSGLSSRV